MPRVRFFSKYKITGSSVKYNARMACILNLIWGLAATDKSTEDVRDALPPAKFGSPISTLPHPGTVNPHCLHSFSQFQMPLAAWTGNGNPS